MAHRYVRDLLSLAPSALGTAASFAGRPGSGQVVPSKIQGFWADEVSSLPLSSVAVPQYLHDLAQEPATVRLLSTSFWMILVIGGAALAYAIYRLVHYLRGMKDLERLSEAQFEAALLASIGTASGTNRSDPKTTDNPTQQRTLEDSPPSPEARPDGAGHVPVDMQCKRLLDQLAAAGLLENIECYVNVAGNPKGAAVLRLRNRKRVLLVPYFETDIFTDRELRCYDGLLFVSRNGKAVYVQSVESLIAQFFG